MNEWSAVLSIAEPLGLAGLALVVLLLAVKAIVSRAVTPASQTHSYKLTQRILTFLFILSLVGMVLGFVGYMIKLIYLPDPSPGREITKISFHEYGFQAVSPEELERFKAAGGPGLPLTSREVKRGEALMATKEEYWIPPNNQRYPSKKSCSAGQPAGSACLLDELGRLTSYQRRDCATKPSPGQAVVAGCSSSIDAFGTSRRLDCCFFHEGPIALGLPFGFDAREFNPQAAH